MRDIKFRAWDSESKEMFYPVWLTRSGIEFGEGGWIGKVANKDNTWEISQFTGLKDKNGKEIFEGDIVRAYTYESSGDEPEDRELDDFTLHEVKWMGEEDYPAFDLVPPTDEEANSISAYVNTPDYSLEVVGNVWENQELVKLMKENTLI